MDAVPNPRDRIGRGAWAAALSAGFACYLDAAALTSISISLAIWRDHFALAVWQVGAVSAGLTFFVAVGALIGGRLGDRLGRARVLNWTLVVFVLGTVLIMAAHEATVLIAGVVLVGLAAGADVPTSLAVIAEQAPDGTQGRLVALTQALWIAGILATFGLGFAVSGLGFAGTRILVVHLVLVASATLMLRLMLSARTPGSGRRGGLRDRSHRSLRLLDLNVLLPLVSTGGFLALWNLAASTLGSYGTYFLVTQTRLSQGQATALVLLTFPPAGALAIAYSWLAESAWRDRLFLVAMPLQVAAFALGAVTGGREVWGMVGLVVLYGLSNVFAGEAAYKVWAQQLLPAELRATALGLTYGVARAAAACFLVVVPVVIDTQPAALLWILTGCVTLSGATGLVIIWHPRLLGRHRSPAADTEPTARVEP